MASSICTGFHLPRWHRHCVGMGLDGDAMNRYTTTALAAILTCGVFALVGWLLQFPFEPVPIVLWSFLCVIAQFWVLPGVWGLMAPENDEWRGPDWDCG